MLSPDDRQMVGVIKEKLGKVHTHTGIHAHMHMHTQKKVIAEDLKEEIIQELETVSYPLTSSHPYSRPPPQKASKSQPLARKLVKKFSQRLLFTVPETSIEERALGILSMARVRYRLEQVCGGV